VATRTSLRLLGGFDLRCADRSVPLPMSAQRLLAFVALHERPAQRAYVAGSLWLDSPEERAYANLRTALWRLHREGVRLVESHGQRLALSASVGVDLRAAESLARRAMHEPGAAAVVTDASVLEDDLLPDWYDDWVVLERERYRQLRLRALETLCEQATDAGDLDAALDFGLAAVAGEPLRESGHRSVIRAHLAAGNAAEAVRQYRLCRRLLQEQLGVEPSEHMEQLLAGLHVAETAR
jgi:DNA-binding SARP family transcriptional activator